MNVAVLGYGTVGKGVVEILDESEEDCCTVSKIFAREKYRDIVGVRLETDIDKILNDNSIDIIVEVLGGEDFAYNCIVKALNRKKHVVTANKNVVSKYFDELTNLAYQNKVSFHYEASVGGGIPIIHTLIKLSAVDEIISIRGILNGTTNYILSQMTSQRISFDDALKDAQALGFAEQNPSDDLEGIDASRKLVILSNIAFKQKINLDNINISGIKSVTEEIIEDISNKGYRIKHVVSAIKDGSQLKLNSELVLVSKDNSLYNISNETNSVVVESSRNKTLVLSGAGAGSLPTASSIVQDCYLIENNHYYRNFLNNNQNLIINNTNEGLYYCVSENGSEIKVANKETLSDCIFFAKVLV